MRTYRTPTGKRASPGAARRLTFAGALVASASTVTASSCGLLGPDDAWLEIAPYHYVVHKPATPEEGSRHVTHNSSLGDSAGIAGLEVRVLGQRFTARDFEPVPCPRALPLNTGCPVKPQAMDIPFTGRLLVDVRLVQDGAVAAQGVVSWLTSDESWRLRIERTSRPFDGFFSPSGEFSCWKCRYYERIPIAPWATNYPEEELWVTWCVARRREPDGADSYHCRWP